MTDEHLKCVPCPAGCSVVYRRSEWIGTRKGQDIDVYHFDVVDAEGEVVGSHEVRDSTSIYPPFERDVSLYK